MKHAVNPGSSTLELLRVALEKIGYTSQPFVLSGTSYTQFISPQGKSWMTSNKFVSYPFVARSARSVFEDKHQSNQLAAKLGASTPWSIAVSSSKLSRTTINTALQHVPLVVKPATSSISRGVSFNIYSKDELVQAIKVAQAFSEKLLIQEQVSGEEMRFVVLNGHVTAAMLRQMPQVVGDGTHSVSQLLKQENEARKQLKMPYVTYPQLTDPLINVSKLDHGAVPAKGEIFKLGRGTMIAHGASIYNVLADVHPSYITLVEKLAGVAGIGLITVDMFIDDYRQPKTERNHAFLEFTLGPALKLFYSCRDGKHYDILDDLVPMIDVAIHNTGVSK